MLLSDRETRGHNLGSGQGEEGNPDSVGYTGFSEAASETLEGGSAPYTGYWVPNQVLSPLTGISPEGSWTLIAKDTNHGGDKGKLLCGLIVLALPPP